MPTTRRILLFDRITADGYFAASDGNLDWVVPDAEIDRTGAAHMHETDTMLFGRRTYEQFESFWPHAADGDDPHAAGRRSPAMLAFAQWINESAKLVFSRTRKDVTWKNSRLFRELDPHEIAALKQQPGKDIMIFGSGSIASQLTQHGLIDEYQLVVSPTLLGNGRTLLNGIPHPSRLSLLEAKAYPSGNVVLRYARSG